MATVPTNVLRVFDGGTAVITGGASGIGRALAEALADRGCEVVVADLQIDMAEEVAESIRASGGKATASELDVTDFSSVQRLVQETVTRTGRLDFVFKNAGIGIGGPLERQDIDDWNLVIDVNLRGVVHGVQAAYPILVEQGFGHIVNTASMAGLVSVIEGVSYATTKHAVVGLSTSLRAEAAFKGIRASVLCPGIVRTPILEKGGKYGKNVGDVTAEQEREFYEKRRPISAEVFAAKSLDAVAKNKAVIVVPSSWKLGWWLDRLSPTLGIYLAKKDHESVLKSRQ